MSENSTLFSACALLSDSSEVTLYKFSVALHYTCFSSTMSDLHVMFNSCGLLTHRVTMLKEERVATTSMSLQSVIIITSVC